MNREHWFVFIVTVLILGMMLSCAPAGHETRVCKYWHIIGYEDVLVVRPYGSYMTKQPQVICTQWVVE